MFLLHDPDAPEPWHTHRKHHFRPLPSSRIRPRRSARWGFRAGVALGVVVGAVLGAVLGGGLVALLVSLANGWLPGLWDLFGGH